MLTAVREQHLTQWSVRALSPPRSAETYQLFSNRLRNSRSPAVHRAGCDSRPRGGAAEPREADRRTVSGVEQSPVEGPDISCPPVEGLRDNRVQRDRTRRNVPTPQRSNRRPVPAPVAPSRTAHGVSIMPAQCGDAFNPALADAVVGETNR